LEETQNVNQITTTNPEQPERKVPTEYIYTIDSDLYGKTIETTLKFMVNGVAKNVNCQMDTGATCNVMGFHDYCQIMNVKDPSMQKSSVSIKCFGGTSIRPMGEAVILCVRNDQRYNWVF
jgi:hypothetical protein